MQPFRYLLLVISLFAFSAASLRAQKESRSYDLVHRPALSATQIVFEYENHLWLVGRSGGTAIRLTSGDGIETDPAFSPDGATIAFTGDYDGNKDVFTIAATGGTPRRLTYHPKNDEVLGWSNQGQILFRSDRAASNWYMQMFSVSPNGGVPSVFPFPNAYSGSLSSDGKLLAYCPHGPAFGYYHDHFFSWGHYKGGLASTIWIARTDDLSRVQIPHEAESDMSPVWLKGEVYFLSARHGKLSLFSYNPLTRQVIERVHSSDSDIDSLAAGPNAVVYSRLGQIYSYDPEKPGEHRIDISVAGDAPEAQPRIVDVHDQIQSMSVSPTGEQAVFEAHGDLFTVPSKPGITRNITRTPGAMERYPSWSPDGKTICYFSDATGSYALYLSDTTGSRNPIIISLDKAATYYFDPLWSPDSRKIVFRDNHLRLWVVDTAKGTAALIGGTNIFRELHRDYAWSPDSQWLAFTRVESNHLNRLYLYSFETTKSTPASDLLTDARYPAFDPTGQFLYFTVSTNYGGAAAGTDMTSDLANASRSLYVVPLAADTRSPFLPDDSENTVVKDGVGPAIGSSTRIDLTGLEARTIAFPLPARDYLKVMAGGSNTVYYIEDGPSQNDAGEKNLYAYHLKEKNAVLLAAGISDAQISANGEKLLIVKGQGASAQFTITSSTNPLKAGEGLLDLSSMQMRSDPKAEWEQMYHEVWRIERAYFYDPNFHGLETIAEERRFEPYVRSLTTRDDLNYIFQVMLTGLSIGHLNGGNAYPPPAQKMPGGLLGVDYVTRDGRYCIQKILTGDSWGATVRGPLAQPGLGVKTGDCILSINGRTVSASDDIQALLQGTAGRLVSLDVISPKEMKSRTVIVTPIADEFPLRRSDWAEHNREIVNKLSDGKLGYVYLSDTGSAGLESFNRSYFAQTDKQGAIVDERFNGGGQLADYFIEVLRRQVMNYWAPRYGEIEHTPNAAIFGPKVMLANEISGSGGDALPWLFKKLHVGPVVGKRTWGGIVGFGNLPKLMDGGAVTAPSTGFFSPDGTWDIENHGVDPDYEVEMNPRSVSEGHDPQLEKAVALAMDAIKKNSPTLHRPPYPTYPY